MNFKDYYSKQAVEYSKFRPTYPDELFQYLNSITDTHNLALDCATGNGQAARGLAKYFKKIIAIDASNAQIRNAYKLHNIEYKVAKAESTGLESKSVDLVTIATAVHWVDAALFYEEVRRVLNNTGVIAVWTYSTTTLINSEIDEVVNSFSERILNDHWDDGIKKVWSFDELEFPFEQIPSTDFYIKREWTYKDYINYIYTWSSVQKFIEVNNYNPAELLQNDLKNVWGNEKRDVLWTIKMKAGRI